MPPGLSRRFLVAGGIEEDLRAFRLEARELALEAEVAAVRTEEDVARERLQDAERAREILRDPGIRRLLIAGVDQVEVRPEAHAADDDGVAQPIGWLAGEMDGQGPRRAASCVASGFVCGERDAAELDGVAVAQDPLDLRRRVGRHSIDREQEVGATAAFHDVGVALHDHVLRAGLAQDLRCAGHVVEVRLAVEQDFRIRPLEPQLLHAHANLRRRRFEVGVDQDVPGGRGNEVCGQLLAADIVK